MVSNPQSAARPPRLNPFVFPSDTTFRFILLIVSVLGASLFIYSLLYFSIPTNRKAWLDTTIRCQNIQSKSTVTLEDLLLSAQTGSGHSLAKQSSAEQAELARCRAPAEQSNAAWMIGGVGVLLTVAGLIYWNFPAWKIRRDKLEPLSGDDAPEVVAYIADLCREVGLSRFPIFLWNPLNLASGGLAFGRWGRYYVTLTGGLVTQFYTDLPAFRAVVLHELAHLRNADVDKTYFAVAIGRAFLITAVLPLAVIIYHNKLEFILNMSWRVLALAALVYLMRSAVLRTREVYADVRASVWDGPDGALSRALESLPQQKAGRWRIALQSHPDPASRRQALEDPGRLFPMGFWDAFGTGLAAAIAFPNVISLLTSLLTGTGLTSLASLGAGLIFSPLAVGVVGAGAWRSTFAALARGKAPNSAGRLGLGLGFGILLGEMLSFHAILDNGTTGFVLLFNILWGIVLLVSLFFFLRWIAAGASAWLEVAATYHSPLLICTAGLTIAGGVLAVWLGLLFYLRVVENISFLVVLASPLGTLWTIVQHPLALPLLISLWAFPLAAWCWRGRVASACESSWAFLDSSPRQLTLPRQSPFRLGLALRIGLAGGLAFCVLLLLARIGLRVGVSEAVRGTDQYRLTFFLAQVGIAALMQAGVATIVANRVQRLSVLHGLFAAFIAGCMMAVGLLGLNLLFGGTIDPQFAWNTFNQVVNQGALLALPITWGASVLTGLVRRAKA